MIDLWSTTVGKARKRRGIASMVIILETAEKRHNVTFTFKEFFRIGIIVTTANSAILIFFITFPFL
jgi:Na+/H+ antiporter NhaD/arsenite permease-like protein